MLMKRVIQIRYIIFMLYAVPLGILTQCLIRYDKLKTQRKLSQHTEGTPGFKAASNPLRSRFEISQEENNL